MSRQDRSARQARGRVVIVGRPAGAGELPQSVIHADNLFDAVGEVTVATASQPVSAVVVPKELVHGTAALAAAAFRRRSCSTSWKMSAVSTTWPQNIPTSSIG